MALRIVPSKNYVTQASNTHDGNASSGAPSAPGLHDTLRSRLHLDGSTTLLESSSSTSSSSSHSQSHPHSSTAATSSTSSHPLEARLRNWQQTQDNLKMNILRRQYGIAEPVRRGMELKVCRDGEWRPQALGGSSRFSEEILMGRDDQITWEDVYRGDGMQEVPYHAEIEARLRVNEL